MECTKVPQVVRKAKKKPVKDELDRIKQAEKKRRRLEKALANSAAIRSELEKKKQKKKEEQQRLDEEGAAIAEAVALHVLLGEESDDSCKIMLEKDESLNLCDSVSNIEFVSEMGLACPYQNFTEHSFEGIAWVPNDYASECYWNEGGKSCPSITSGPFCQNLHMPYSDMSGWGTTEISADFLAAQAVASLQIGEDADVDTYIFNRMFRG